MALEDIEFTKNDTLPSYTWTLYRTGSTSTPFNLTNYSVALKVRSQSGSTNKFTKTVTNVASTDGAISNSTGGQVRFDWVSGNWNTTGTYIGEFSIINASSKVETVPDRQTFLVKSEY